MRKTTQILAALLIAALLLPVITTVAFAADSTTELNASIDDVYGGAKGIVTMTFDDGDYATAQALKTLCDKYDLYATLMLVPSRISADGTGQTTPEQWYEIFESGRIEPQSHSMTHSGALGSKNSPSTEVIEREVIDSLERLNELFPEMDILCYAPQGGGDEYNCLTDEARALVMSHYYMVRSAGNDTLQSISPSFEFGELGSWSYISSPSVDNKTIGELTRWIEETVKKGAWFCSYGHKIAETADTRVSAYETMDQWFAYLAESRDKGDIWVTTVSSAVKYLRERQNSTVSASYDGSNVTITVDMADRTEDGLALPADVFNQPLSVKVELPDTARSNYRYTVNGECYTTQVFKEGIKKYIRIDVLPDSVVTLSSIGKDDGAHDLESVKGTPATCIGGGTIDHLACKDCGALFDKSGDPIESISTDEIGAHSLESVGRVEPTETAEGNIAHEHCTLCGKNFDLIGTELADVSIPKLDPPDDGGDKPGATLFIWIAVAVVAVAAVAVTSVVIIKKKRK